MAEFSGKIISAQYIDAEYSIIKVVYDDNGVPTVYNLDVNPEHPDYQDLVAEGWTQEKLIEETAEIKRAQTAAFNVEVMTAAKQLMGLEIIRQEKDKLLSEVDSVKKQLLDLDQVTKVKTKTVDSELYNYILNENENKEELFKCKLWALELDQVKGADKSVKSSIRKSTRITQVLSIVDNLL